MDELERLAVLETQIQGIHRRLEKYDEERGWIIKLVLGVIVMAVLGLVINSGGN